MLHQETSLKTRLLGALLVTIVAAFCYFPFLGSYPLWDPWEPHYSQVAWEMGERSTWMNPSYQWKDNWWSKPIGALWMLKSSFYIFGDKHPSDIWDQPRINYQGHDNITPHKITLYSRIPFAVVGVIGIFLFFWWVSALLGVKIALLSSVILTTSPQYFLLARQVMVDSPFVIFYSCSMGFLAVWYFRGKSFIHLLLFYFFSALALLTKGFLAQFLPVIIGISYALITREWKILKELKIHYGLLIILAIAGPWYGYMSVVHGWPYWKEFIFYHHFDRMAGTIDKISGTFDVYVRQIAYALFPWSGFIPLAGILLARQSSKGLDENHKKFMLYLFLCIAAPYIFLSFSGTKFHHYIFPVVPFIAVLLGYSIFQIPKIRMNRAIILMFLISLSVFAIFANDIVQDYRHLLRLVIFYYDRDGDPAFWPYMPLAVIFYSFGIILAVWILFPKFREKYLVALSAIAIAFTCYTGWEIMPQMKDTYSLEPLFYAYRQNAKPGEPIGDFINWDQPRRSVLFLFQNQIAHLKTQEKAVDYFRRNKRAFALVDHSAWPNFQKVIKERLNKNLKIVFKDHPSTSLVVSSTSDDDKTIIQENIFTSHTLPPIQQKMDVNFGNKITLVGLNVKNHEVKKGEYLEFETFWRTDEEMKKNYQMFIHGDGPKQAKQRIHGDHYLLDGLYMTSEWKKEEIVRDRFSLRIPIDYQFDWFNLWVGLYDGAERLSIINHQQSPNDGNNRLRMVTIQVKD